MSILAKKTEVHRCLIWDQSLPWDLSNETGLEKAQERVTDSIAKAPGRIQFLPYFRRNTNAPVSKKNEIAT